MKEKIRIAIDGPSGAGKSSLARLVAEKLGILYVDTGALYRTIGLYMARHGVALGDREKALALLPDVHPTLAYQNGQQHVFLGDEDVSGLIRTPEISLYASFVSAIPAVREKLLSLQKETAQTQSVVMDGRDIGTVILPDADVKLFLIASDACRAHRRFLELTEKGVATTEEEVLADMKKRDADDANRDIAPAVPAKDAILLDNSLLGREETVEEALRLIRETLEKKKQAGENASKV